MFDLAPLSVFSLGQVLILAIPYFNVSKRPNAQKDGRKPHGDHCAVDGGVILDAWELC